MPAEMADRQSIAITDLSCRFPGKGDDLAGFWQSICSGKCMSSPFKICSLREADDVLPYRRGPRSLMSDSDDGGTLGYLFQGVEDAKARPGRLRMFQQARLARAARVQKPDRRMNPENTCKVRPKCEPLHATDYTCNQRTSRIGETYRAAADEQSLVCRCCRK